MISVATMAVLLSRSDSLVEAAILGLVRDNVLSGPDLKEARYYSWWIKRGNPLDGKFLPKARALTIRHSLTLADMANAKAANKVQGTTNKFPHPFCPEAPRVSCKQAKVNNEGATALLAALAALDHNKEDLAFIASFTG